jgi:hypothetical protein
MKHHLCEKFGKTGIRSIPGHPYVSCTCASKDGHRVSECWIPAEQWSLRHQSTATEPKGKAARSASFPQGFFHLDGFKDHVPA